MNGAMPSAGSCQVNVTEPWLSVRLTWLGGSPTMLGEAETGGATVSIGRRYAGGSGLGAWSPRPRTADAPMSRAAAPMITAVVMLTTRPRGRRRSPSCVDGRGTGSVRAGTGVTDI